MKRLITLVLLLVPGVALADNHTEVHWSKFQANFHFTCEMPADCVAAYSTLMSSPEMEAQKYETALYTMAHNGWDEATHAITFYFKDAQQYAEAGQVFATSPAMAAFLEAGREAGNETQYQTLSTHTVVSGNPVGTKAQLRWSINVSDPATFVPAWQKMSEAFAEKPWASKAYGLQTYLLGNTGTMTHEIWAAFDNPVQALTFLEMFPQTEEWQAYSAETRDAVSLVRSYMALTAVSLNED
jgi:hypothetical protein